MDIIGTEEVARLFDTRAPDKLFSVGHYQALAAVQRLIPEQAIAALAHVIGRDVELAARALERATDGEYRF